MIYLLRIWKKNQEKFETLKAFLHYTLFWSFSSPCLPKMWVTEPVKDRLLSSMDMPTDVLQRDYNFFLLLVDLKIIGVFEKPSSTDRLR